MAGRSAQPRAEQGAGGRGRAKDPEQEARNILLRQLTATAKTRAQLETALAARGVDAELAERLLDRFTEVGLINDAEFAQSWVESRSRNKGLSRRALQRELQRKGISAEDQEAALSGLSDEDQFAAALSYATSRARRMTDQDPLTAKRRLAGALARRGYSPGLCFEVARRVIEERELS